MNPERVFIEDLYKDYGDFLTNVCISWVRPRTDCDDLVPETVQWTFLKAQVHYEKLTTHQNVPGWLVETCKKRLRSEMRKRNRRAKRETTFEENLTMDQPIADSIESLLDREAFLSIVQRCKSILTPSQQKIFIARFIENMQIREIADREGISEEAVKSRLAKIKKRLQQHRNFFTIFFLGGIFLLLTGTI